MLAIRLSNNHECLFDAGTITYNLSVCVKPDGYKTIVYTTGINKSKLFCRILLNAPKGLEVDHINGNTLDNRKCNLRLVTSQQNKFNTKKRGDLSLPKGVHRHGNNYRAAITHNYTRYNLGTYPTVERAEAAYKAKAEAFQKEYAFHNRKIIANV